MHEVECYIAVKKNKLCGATCKLQEDNVSINK